MSTRSSMFMSRHMEQFERVKRYIKLIIMIIRIFGGPVLIPLP
jgi:hypothetical protein